MAIESVPVIWTEYTASIQETVYAYWFLVGKPQENRPVKSHITGMGCEGVGSIQLAHVGSFGGLFQTPHYIRKIRIDY
jgi:hypothetical protein